MYFWGIFNYFVIFNYGMCKFLDMETCIFHKTVRNGICELDPFII